MCILRICVLSFAPQTLVALILTGKSSQRHCFCKTASGSELAYCLCAVEAVRRGKSSIKQRGNALRQLAGANELFLSLCVNGQWKRCYCHGMALWSFSVQQTFACRAALAGYTYLMLGSSVGSVVLPKSNDKPRCVIALASFAYH